jgi:hypothetical protein
VFIRFVFIGEIVDHHCLGFLSITPTHLTNNLRKRNDDTTLNTGMVRA